MTSSPFVSLLPLIGVLAIWPLDWARGLLQLQASAQRRASDVGSLPPPGSEARLADSAATWHASGVGAGFDLVRAHYAAAVQAGLIQRSLLASGALERRLAALERIALGSKARVV